MTKEEYDLKMDEISKIFEASKSALAKEYAFSNNKVAIGTIVTDHIGSLQVQKIKYTTGSVLFGKLPECVYYGIELKKDGNPAKKQMGRGVYQSNLITS